MSITWFVSDLHLGGTASDVPERFIRFLKEQAARADRLYILGDLFEHWVGDDYPMPDARSVIDALQALARAGLTTFLVRGNRDFLIGEQFAKHCGLTLLGDQAVIDLYGTPTLIMHGDTLCTDDVAYQRLRRSLRDPRWQQRFLSLPYGERLSQAAQLRRQSQKAMDEKPAHAVDVNEAAVGQTMREHSVSRLIHGHTHQPGIHCFRIDGRPACRVVLGDWQRTGVALRCTAHSTELTAVQT